MAWLAGPYKQLMEALKAAGLIVDYAVYATTPRSPHDPDLYLRHGLQEHGGARRLGQPRATRSRRSCRAAWPSRTRRYVERGKMRTVLGSELIREAVLK